MPVRPRALYTRTTIHGSIPLSAFGRLRSGLPDEIYRPCRPSLRIYRLWTQPYVTELLVRGQDAVWLHRGKLRSIPKEDNAPTVQVVAAKALARHNTQEDLY